MMYNPVRLNVRAQLHERCGGKYRHSLSSSTVPPNTNNPLPPPVDFVFPHSLSEDIEKALFALHVSQPQSLASPKSYPLKAGSLITNFQRGTNDALKYRLVVAKNLTVDELVAMRVE
jgi:hypothetical protein